MSVDTEKLDVHFPYVGGKFVKTGHLKSIVNPYNGDIVGKVHFADDDLIKQVVDRSVEGFEKMKNMPTFRRAEILENIARAIEKSAEKISNLLAREAGKPIKYARGEVQRCIITFKTAAEEAKRINGEILPLDWSVSSQNRTGYTRRFPIGVILGITPFNFPLNLVAHKVAPALAAGNSIIIKPASVDPISALTLVRIADDVGVPPGVLQVIPARVETIQPIIEDERVRMLTFTGSAEVGWKLKEKAGKKRVALELGGNAGVIVDKGANLEYARDRILMGGFAYAGQVCISVQRIYIHRDIYDEFVNALIEGVETRVKIGDPLDPEVTLSSLITEEEAVRVHSWVQEAVDKGAEILIGGKREGSVFEPTILSHVYRDTRVYKDEVFGPVVLVEPFDSFEEAINMVNDSRYGLQAGVFTPDLEKALAAFDKIEAGGVMINDVPTFRIDPMPYGGARESGFGREGLKYSIEEMTELKLMVINRKGGG